MVSLRVDGVRGALPDPIGQPKGLGVKKNTVSQPNPSSPRGKCPMTGEPGTAPPDRPWKGNVNQKGFATCRHGYAVQGRPPLRFGIRYGPLPRRPVIVARTSLPGATLAARCGGRAGKYQAPEGLWTVTIRFVNNGVSPGRTTGRKWISLPKSWYQRLEELLGPF